METHHLKEEREAYKYSLQLLLKENHRLEVSNLNTHNYLFGSDVLLFFINTINQFHNLDIPAISFCKVLKPVASR
jgi:hypothetical protein